MTPVSETRASQILQSFNHYAIEHTHSGTPTAVFYGPTLPSCMSNGFSVGGQHGVIVHDLVSISRFLEEASLPTGPDAKVPGGTGAGEAGARGIALWQRARAELEAMSAQHTRRNAVPGLVAA